MATPIQTIDISGEVAALLPSYPKEMRELVSKYSEHKAFFDKDKNRVCYTSTVRASDLGAFHLAMSQDSAKALSYIKTPGVDSDDCRKHLFSVDDGFYGLSSEDYMREITGESRTMQEALEVARKEVEKSGVKEALENSMQGMKKKRRRTFSEHDGDFDHDRKWDATPFSATKMDRKEFPYIEFIFPINNGGGTSHESITRFGARALALAEVMENAGYRVAITAESWGMGKIRNNKTSNTLAKSLGSTNDPYVYECERCILRGPDDYGDVQSFAIYSGPTFYRRTMFGFTYQAAHYIHGIEAALQNNVTGGYGRSIDERPIPSEPGQIILTRELMQTLFTGTKDLAAKAFQERVLFSVSPDKAEAMSRNSISA